MTISDSKSQTTERCADCGAPATRRSADGVPLCESDYEHLVEHWNREFGESADADTTIPPSDHVIPADKM